MHPAAREVIRSEVQGHQIKQNVSERLISYDAYNTRKHLLVEFINYLALKLVL